MPNIYDKAYELARMIEENEYYIKLKALSEKVRNNKEYLEMVEAYQIKQFELYNRKESGEELTEEESKNLNDQYQKLMSIEDIKSLFEVEHQLSLLINDLYRIFNAPLLTLNPQEGKKEEDI